MKISRDWATPLTIGAFGLMAVTGILMFFHLDSGLNKPAHEWLGWVMVAGVGAHATANWLGFKRYFLSSAQGRAILATSLVVLAGSFVSLPGGRDKGASPPQLAMRALTQAPLAQVAPLTGKPLAQLITELGAAGIPVASGEQTLAQAVGSDKERTGQALRVLFAAPAQPAP